MHSGGKSPVTYLGDISRRDLGTSSKVIPRVSEQRWPMLTSFRPTVIPVRRDVQSK